MFIQKHNQKQSFGFTLIELLVVIAIIALLASITIASVNRARMKARDAVRKSDLRQISLALSMYYQTYGRYPAEVNCLDTSVGISNGTGCPVPTPPGTTWGVTSDLQTLITEKYMGELPIDPINNEIYYYYYESDNIGQGNPVCTVNTCSYVLRARLESVTSGSPWYYHDTYGVGIR
jgi:prepilin-type N-terminal cleavage/methylation domain-containing protein